MGKTFSIVGLYLVLFFLCCYWLFMTYCLADIWWPAHSLGWVGDDSFFGRLLLLTIPIIGGLLVYSRAAALVRKSS